MADEWYWRKWAWDTLSGSAELAALLPEGNLYGSGALTGSPRQRPFVMITFGQRFPRTDAPGTYDQLFSVWAHDEPGDYGRIDSILRVAERALVGPIPLEDAVRCRVTDISADLADDSFGTITRNSAFVIIGKEPA